MKLIHIADLHLPCYSFIYKLPEKVGNSSLENSDTHEQ